MIVAHSHLFFFFPVSACWRCLRSICPPSSSRDLYWHHLPYGKLRFLVGLVAVAAVSYGFARSLDKPPRAIWEASPSCAGWPTRAIRGLRRQARILDALPRRRCAEKAQTRRRPLRTSRAPAAPTRCMETARGNGEEALLLPGQGACSPAPECCRVQERSPTRCSACRQNPATRSLSAMLRSLIFLPLKIFFVLIVVAIGIAADDLARPHRPAVRRPDSAAGARRHHRCLGHAVLAGHGLRLPADRQRAVRPLADPGLQLRLSLVIAPWVAAAAVLLPAPPRQAG